MTDRYRDKPYSADDDDGRDPYAREGQGAAKRSGESDPLAELARLIGQTDPFSSFAREQQQPAPQRGSYETQQNYQEPTYNDEPAPTPSWMRNRVPAQPPQADNDAYGDRYSDDPYAASPRGYEQTPRFEEVPRFDPIPADPRAARGGDPSRYDDVLFGQKERDPNQDTRYQTQDDDFRDDPFARADYDDNLDEEAPKARRGGKLTVIAVLLLAVAGTGAAFGYRTIFGSPRSGEPPVIKADAGPNKVVPAGSGKQITDRVGDKGGERVVSREEQPLDVNGKPQPRVVFPALTQNANPPAVTSANTGSRPTGAGVGNGTLGGDEPRKIRTLAIRPDGSDSVAAPVSAPAAAQPAPRQIPTQAPAPRAPPPSSTSSTPSPANGGPIALTPQSQQPVAETRSRVASVSPPPSGGNGAYVQVSSQKTEADAQASYRALQAKYAGILGSRNSSIRRADLGEKGVFYRAMVGPFGTADEATQFCVNLKSAGGQCIVQR